MRLGSSVIDRFSTGADFFSSLLADHSRFAPCIGTPLRLQLKHALVVTQRRITSRTCDVDILAKRDEILQRALMR